MPHCPKALIFDLDGTLYESGPLRQAMLRRVARAYVRRPWEGISVIKGLRCYRKAQELLRKHDQTTVDIGTAQVHLASQLSGFPASVLAGWVSRWMEEEPLPLLRSYMRQGLVDLLERATQHGYGLAVCSDYPAAKKISAMDLDRYFDVVVTSHDVQRLKPNPASLQQALHRLGVRSEYAVYIGDRQSVDNEAASRAGTQCIILSAGQSFADLSRLLIPSCQPA